MSNANSNKTKTFRNKNFTVRDYECTNVVACSAIECPGPQWLPAEDSLLNGLNHLETVAGVRYYGWL